MSEPLAIEAGCSCGGLFQMETEQDWFVRAAFETWKAAHFGRLENTFAHRHVPVAKAREIRALDELVASMPSAQAAIEFEQRRQARLRGPAGPVQLPLSDGAGTGPGGGASPEGKPLLAPSVGGPRS